jgi:hypothetical protein
LFYGVLYDSVHIYKSVTTSIWIVDIFFLIGRRFPQ